MTFFEKLQNFFNTSLFHVGESDVTIGTITYLVVGLALLTIFARFLKLILVRGIFRKAGLAPAVANSVGNVIKFFILIIGFIIIVQGAGIDLSALSLLAGALGVGIGFGLQNITDNFISGIIILFEKPIKIGDRIEVGDVVGNVVSISIRATTILTNDNIAIIVPNSEFISKLVINWSHNDQNIRFTIPVGVSYKEDPEKIRQILLEEAGKNEHVLKAPEPAVIFDAFGDSSLNFKLLVWTSDYINSPGLLRSELNFAIFDRFKKEGVEIPFPQRDIHIRSGSFQ
jgi:small-conductance mechanosensitive channel